MQKIKQLSPHEAQKIAAGEVVERPSNIVKELIENSLDAGATHISLYLEDGGRKLIRIVDNGCGMSLEDARMSIKTHTTSKITCVNDLEHVLTFGFRGEALSSICSVSKVNLTTKEDSILQGTALTIENGIVINEAITSCNTGTDIVINDIFYNVPARQKFLKTKETELRAINQIFYAFALAYPHVSFNLFHENKVVQTINQTNSLINRIHQIYEHKLAESALKIHKYEPTRAITITGAISDPNYTRYDRNQIFLFVNQRWVKNHKLVSAVLKGYQSMLQPEKYPAAFIFIEIDPSQVDINIHPRKEEVQFVNPKIVESLLQTAVKEALEAKFTKQLGNIHSTQIANQQSANKLQLHDQLIERNSISIQSQKPTIEDQKKFEDIISMSFATSVEEPHQSDLKLNSSNLAHLQKLDDNKPIALQQPNTNTMAQDANTHSTQKTLNGANSYEGVKQATDIESQDINRQIGTNEELLDYTIIGQAILTYIIIQTNEGLTFIDQHAAHERILYEKFRSKFNEITRIRLLFAQIIQLTSGDLKALLPYLELFASCGLIIEQISSNEIMIKETPIFLKNQPLDNIIKQAISWIYASNSLDKDSLKESLQEKIHAELSCKAAIKAGDLLNLATMHQIIKELNATENKLTCPHGRPTTWALSTSEIEKKFKRNYK